MKTDEMVEILEGLIRDPETNPTAKCTRSDVDAARRRAPW